MDQWKINKNKYIQEYKKQNYKRIPLDIAADYYRDILKPAADRAGLPVNTFIKNAIQEKIDNENNV